MHDEKEIVEILEKIKVILQGGIKEYDPTFHNKLVCTQYFVDSALISETSQWKVKTSIKKISATDCEIDSSITCIQGELRDASVFLEFQIADWSESNFLLMPAVCYNGNRYQSRPQQYMPFFYNYEDLSREEKVLLSDVPRLTRNGDVSKIDERTGSMSVPVISYLDQKNNRSVILSIPMTVNGKDCGISFEESKDRNKAILTYTAPVVREVYQYRMTNTRFPSQDRPHNYVEGDEIRFSFRISLRSCESVIGHLENHNHVANASYMNETDATFHNISYSKAFSIQEKKFNESNFVEKHGYYAVGLQENPFQDWQLGWTGGLISTLPLLAAGSKMSKKRVYSTFNWFFEYAIAPSGLFWGIGEKGTSFFGEFEHTKPLGKDLLLVRKMADAIYYIIKQFNIFKSQNVSIPASWDKKLKIAIDKIVEIWEANHQLGHYIDIHTCEIVVGGSTSGGLMPASLCLASEYFGEEEYASTALAMGDYFYNDYVSNGLTYGGVGDAMHNFDSESCYGILESFCVLAEREKSDDWVNKSKIASYLFRTWVCHYNYDFPKGTLFEVLKMKTVGTVFANTQNKHLAPGICTYSGVALLRLFRLTNDTQYLYLLQKIVRAIPGYLSHAERPIGNMKEGWISERINTTDWWEPIGEIFEGSTWSETSCMLSRVEIPGIYIVRDINLVVTFDHVEAVFINENQIRISNIQEYEIEVSILEESSVEFNRPFSNNLFTESQSRKIPAKQSMDYQLAVNIR